MPCQSNGELAEGKKILLSQGDRTWCLSPKELAFELLAKGLADWLCQMCVVSTAGLPVVNTSSQNQFPNKQEQLQRIRDHHCNHTKIAFNCVVLFSYGHYLWIYF